MKATNKTIKFSYMENGEEKQVTRKIYEKDGMEYIIFENEYIPILDERGIYLNWMQDIQVLENFNVLSASKKGRPKTENPKGVTLNIRLDATRKRFIDDYSQKNNITKGETIRRAVDKLQEEE